MDPEKNGRWTEEEHERFLAGYAEYGKQWVKVTQVVGTRTRVQVRSHAQKYFKKFANIKKKARPMDFQSLGQKIPVPPCLGSNELHIVSPSTSPNNSGTFQSTVWPEFLDTFSDPVSSGLKRKSSELQLDNIPKVSCLKIPLFEDIVTSHESTLQPNSPISSTGLYLDPISVECDDPLLIEAQALVCPEPIDAFTQTMKIDDDFFDIMRDMN